MTIVSNERKYYQSSSINVILVFVVTEDINHFVPEPLPGVVDADNRRHDERRQRLEADDEQGRHDQLVQQLCQHRRRRLGRLVVGRCRRRASHFLEFKSIQTRKSFVFSRTVRNVYTSADVGFKVRT